MRQSDIVNDKNVARTFGKKCGTIGVCAPDAVLTQDAIVRQPHAAPGSIEKGLETIYVRGGTLGVLVIYVVDVVGLEQVPPAEVVDAVCIQTQARVEAIRAELNGL